MTKQYKKTWNYFVSIGKIPTNANTTGSDCYGRCLPNIQCYVLHHKDMNFKKEDPKRYKEYRIEDIEPMEFGYHSSYHQKLRKGMSDQEARKSIENDKALMQATIEEWVRASNKETTDGH